MSATETFTPSSAKNNLTVVMYGLNPIPGQLNPVVDHFQRQSDVLTYTYDNRIVMSGNPHALPEFVDEMTCTVENRAEAYSRDRVRIVGVSLGAFIGANIQDTLQLEQCGLYGAAGCPTAKNFMFNPIFYPLAEKMRMNGFEYREVADVWSDIDFTAERRVHSGKLLLTVSRLDPVVPFPLVKKAMEKWQQKGTRVHLVKSWDVGHTASINTFAGNIAQLEHLSERLFN